MFLLVEECELKSVLCCNYGVPNVCLQGDNEEDWCMIYAPIATNSLEELSAKKQPAAV